MYVSKTILQNIIFKESERKKAERIIAKYVAEGYSIESLEDFSGNDEYPICTQLMRTERHGD